MFLLILTTLGPLVSFEGLVSYYGDEIDMWGDMTVAVEDMHTVTFTLTRCGIEPRLVLSSVPVLIQTVHDNRILTNPEYIQANKYILQR